mmetsp:Transcript_13917/g.25659  ORF Transcript_13917/g.25659 Transcript_13917/m.25659 type:complete len:276 (+) Transcript_13917:92-919(+)
MERLSHAAAFLVIINQVMRTSSLAVTYSGYVIDNLCYDRVIDGIPALDLSDILFRPQDHKVYCMRDVARCINSGFYLAYRCPDGSYRPRFQLDETVSHGNTLSLIQSTSTSVGLAITVTGDASSGSIHGGTVVECFGSDCDGVCSGDCGNTSALCATSSSTSSSFSSSTSLTTEASTARTSSSTTSPSSLPSSTSHTAEASDGTDSTDSTVAASTSSSHTSSSTSHTAEASDLSEVNSTTSGAVAPDMTDSAPSAASVASRWLPLAVVAMVSVGH